MLLSRDKSQLLIIDVQEKLLPAMSDPERVVERCIRLVRAARALDIPVTVSEQYPRGIGPDGLAAARSPRQFRLGHGQSRVLLREERPFARASA